jgi:hypothetical protein
MMLQRCIIAVVHPELNCGNVCGLMLLCRHRFVDSISVSFRKFSVSFAGQFSSKSQNRGEWVQAARGCHHVGNRSAMFKETSRFNDPAALGTEE